MELRDSIFLSVSIISKFQNGNDFKCKGFCLAKKIYPNPNECCEVWKSLSWARSEEVHVRLICEFSERSAHFGWSWALLPAPANTQWVAKGAEKDLRILSYTSWQILVLISPGLSYCYGYGSGTAMETLSNAMKKIVNAFEVLRSHRKQNKTKNQQEELKVVSWKQGCADREHQRSQNLFPGQAEFKLLSFSSALWILLRTENQRSLLTQIVIISV